MEKSKMLKSSSYNEDKEVTTSLEVIPHSNVICQADIDVTMIYNIGKDIRKCEYSDKTPLFCDEEYESLSESAITDNIENYDNKKNPKMRFSGIELNNKEVFGSKEAFFLNKNDCGSTETQTTIMLEIEPCEYQSRMSNCDIDDSASYDMHYEHSEMDTSDSANNANDDIHHDQHEAQTTIMLEIDPFEYRSRMSSCDIDDNARYDMHYEHSELDTSDSANNTIDDTHHDQHETTIMLEIDPDCSDEFQPGMYINNNEANERPRENINDREGDVNEQDLHLTNISGRRIVDIGSLFNRIKQIDSHSETCNFGNMQFIHEIKKGFHSTFEFICTNCNAYQRVESSSRNDNSIGVNEAAVLGIRSIGLGRAHIDELFAHFNIPTMSNTLYDSHNKIHQKDWWYLAKKSALDALKKEIELAVKNNEVDSAGNARLSVKVDGSWGKRSMGSNMSSLSGCAVIIGMRTRKIIYFDVRNKYCHVCTLAKVNKKEFKQHDCNKNYSGPSSGMETDIVVNGFIECELHGARFDKFVSDGDSNTYKVICDLRIYKDPDMYVEKIDCCNHVHKNYRKKWRSLQNSKAYPTECRKYMTNKKCLDICKGVYMAAAHWRDSEIDMTAKVSNLANDVMNAPNHYFGSHTNCASYFCDKQKENEDEQPVLKLLKDCKLYDAILDACQHYFSNNAKSLLTNFTTNDNESFNNLICKRTDGKRINNYLAGTYGGSVAESVVHWNSGFQSGSEYHNFKVGDSSNINKVELSRKRKCESNLKKKQLNPKKRKVIEPEETGKKSYGFNSERPDMQPDVFERAKQRFMKKLERRQQERDDIQKKTVGQTIIPYWFEIRRDLLTSAFFGRIVNNQNKSSFKNLIDEIMCKRTEFGNNKENKHQGIEEKKALKLFESVYAKLPLEDAGIFIDSELCFLGTSPFKLYGDKCILNIKCPLKEFHLSASEAMKKLSYWKTIKGKQIVNEKSDWFVEMQGQLRITNRKAGFILVWLANEHILVKILKDDDFFNVEMKEKLSFFYNEVMLKELVNSRKGRTMQFREYNQELNQFL